MGQDQRKLSAVWQSRPHSDIRRRETHVKLLVSPLHTVRRGRTGRARRANDRHKKWEKDRTLSFIPPDGRFLLLEYEAPRRTTLPLVVKAGLTLEEGGGKHDRPLAIRS